MFTLQSLDNVVKLLIVDDYRDLRIHLYKNDVTPDKNTVLADLTESTFTGYANLDGTVFGATSHTGADESASDGPEMQWECTADGAAQQAFGMYTTFLNAAAARVMLTVDRFDEPVTIAFNHDKVKKKLKFRAKNYAP